ncbi:MAG: hypothetical protein Rpha_0109 [Candidatus Ruthia sp. Apha_13_S6]|nr:hypothetical protein [Candidatus Ruthia sp. Apha_13_S6]
MAHGKSLSIVHYANQLIENAILKTKIQIILFVPNASWFSRLLNII